MARVSDVNTTDIRDAIRLGCRTMSNVFNADDNDIPFFGVLARPEAAMTPGMADHVPGRHLNGLLNAEVAAGIKLDEEVIDKHARAAVFSYTGPLPLPMRRSGNGGPMVVLGPHSIRDIAVERRV